MISRHFFEQQPEKCSTTDILELRQHLEAYLVQGKFAPKKTLASEELQQYTDNQVLIERIKNYCYAFERKEEVALMMIRVELRRRGITT